MITSTLKQSKETYKIHSVTRGRNEYNTQTNIIQWNNTKINRCLDFSEMTTVTGNWIRKRNPEEALYHELIHAYYDNQNQTFVGTTKQEKQNAITKEEARAVRQENIIRKELGYLDDGRTEIEYYFPWFW